MCLECGGVVFCGVGVECGYGEWGDVGVEVLGELGGAVVFEVVAGVVTFGEWYCPGLCLDFGCGVPGGSGGFLSGVIAVEYVDDCACFSCEALQGLDVFVGDCGAAGCVDVAVAVVVEGDDVELPFNEVAGLLFSGCFGGF